MTPRRESCLQERQVSQHLCTWSPSSPLAVNVKSAFLYGRARRPIFIDVPAEDPRSQEEGMLAKLIGSLYGTRDAPLIWQDCLRNEMKRLGFVESLRVPCLFFHVFMNVEMIVHVDCLSLVPWRT